MSLTSAYTAFLRSGAATEAGPLAGALRAHGYMLEAHLLDRWISGETEVIVDVDGLVWAGRRAWIGTALPAEPHAGDLWLDLRELVPMILLPREFDDDFPQQGRAVLTPFVGWLSLRPVAGWQFAGLLEEAPIAARAVHLEPPIPTLDRARLVPAAEDAPVRGALADEAVLYATWFGKGLANYEIWQAAAATLGPEELAALWGPLVSEWADSVDEGVRSVISRETAHDDPDEEYRGGGDGFYGDYAAPEDVGFRTAVSSQLGLSSSVHDSISVLDVKLLQGVNRAE